MAAASLTPLLIRARDVGLSLYVEDGYVVATPKASITPELRAEFRQHKPELVEALTWSESTAHALLKDGAAYLAEFYIRANRPECELADLHAYEDAIDEAMSKSDMHLLRVAVREWVEAGVEMFKAREGDRGTAA